MLSGISGYYIIYALFTILLFILFRRHMQESKSAMIVFAIAAGVGLLMPFFLFILGMTATITLGIILFLGLTFFRPSVGQADVHEEIQAEREQEGAADNQEEMGLASEVAVAQEKSSEQNVIPQGNEQEAIDQLLAELSFQDEQAEEKPEIPQEEEANLLLDQEEPLLTIDADYLLLEDDSPMVIEQQDISEVTELDDKNEAEREPEDDIIYLEAEMDIDDLRFEEVEKDIKASSVPQIPMESREDQEEEYLLELQKVLQEEEQNK